MKIGIFNLIISEYSIIYCYKFDLNSNNLLKNITKLNLNKYI